MPDFSEIMGKPFVESPILADFLAVGAFSPLALLSDLSDFSMLIEPEVMLDTSMDVPRLFSATFPVAPAGLL